MRYCVKVEPLLVVWDGDELPPPEEYEFPSLDKAWQFIAEAIDQTRFVTQVSFVK